MADRVYIPALVYSCFHYIGSWSTGSFKVVVLRALKLTANQPAGWLLLLR